MSVLQATVLIVWFYIVGILGFCLGAEWERSAGMKVQKVAIEGR